MSDADDLLLERVHPPGWVNPVPRDRYHLVVLGGGTAGLVSAIGAALLGARVALVERDRLGGDCLNTGCVPSKALLRAARAVREARGAARLGVHVGEVAVDFGQVMAHVRRVRSHIAAHDAAAQVRSFGVDVFFGEARFDSRTSVVVGEQRLRFKRAVIATGARPSAPDLPPGYLTSESVFELTERPARLLVVGGGPVGCELAQAFALLGSQVTLVERGPQLLPREDPDVGTLLCRILRGDGVDVRLSTSIERGGLIAGRSTEFDSVLVGVGRTPNVDLNLEAAGVAFDPHHGVSVNDRLQTTNHRIFAAGDVCMRQKFTHAADAAARLVVQNALFFGRRRVSELVIPWCTYTSPEVARVGLSQRDAEAQGVEVQTFTVAHDELDRALTDDDPAGFTRLLVHRGKLVGATIVGDRAGDIIGEVTMACTLGVPLSHMARVIHPYPTRAEAVSKAVDAWQLTRLTPWLKRLLRLWFR